MFSRPDYAGWRKSGESSKPNGGGSVSMLEAEVRPRRFGGRKGTSATRKLHKRLHTHRTFDPEQVDLNAKAPACGAFAEPSDGLEPSTPSLPWRCSTN
jgi:hypothetical protein